MKKLKNIAIGICAALVVCFTASPTIFAHGGLDYEQIDKQLECQILHAAR